MLCSLSDSPERRVVACLNRTPEAFRPKPGGGRGDENINAGDWVLNVLNALIIFCIFKLLPLSIYIYAGEGTVDEASTTVSDSCSGVFLFQVMTRGDKVDRCRFSERKICVRGLSTVHVVRR